MGDKQRSEIQKPVKNTLLSGASHGFPFENFQGSSLLIPVSQDSPSVLNDSAGDANKSVSKELTHSENVAEPTVSTTTWNMSPPAVEPNESKNTPAPASHGYSGLFSFFSGGSQKKQETDFGQNENKNSNQSSGSSAPPPPPPQSSSPFVTIPPVQSFSPALYVPSAVTENPQNDPLPVSTGFPTESPPARTFILKSQEETQPNLDSEFIQNKNPTVPPTYFPDTDFPIDKSRAQTFFNPGDVPKTDLEIANQNVKTAIGFEAFSTPDSSVLTKAHSAIDLIGGAPSENPTNQSNMFSNSIQSNTPAPQFSQTRTGSVDSISSFQPPPFGTPSLSAPLTAPPMSSGAATRNYRRDHHKRLAYAQVPGLTSNRAVSSWYLTPCDNLSTPISTSSTVSESTKPTLTGSLSQPALNISATNSSSSTFSMGSSSTSTYSLSNFFPSQSSTFKQETFSPAVDPYSSRGTLPSFDTVSTSSFVSPCVVPPHDVHPPIMSTREQAPSYIPTTTHSDRSPSPVVIPPSLNNLANLGTSGIIYRPVYHHWFIKTETKDSKEIWHPFSMTDSLALEQAFNSDTLTPDTVISTDGGRYDVNIVSRTRTSVYWDEEPKVVRRCSWFFKNTTESRLHPYDENTAFNLEEEYKKAVTTNTWSRKVELPTGDSVFMYGPSSMALFQATPQTPEGWEAEQDYTQSEQRRPKIIKRGVLDDFDIEEGESPAVDHLIFVVHGIGSVCDFRFRTIEEAGNDSDECSSENTIIGKGELYRCKGTGIILELDAHQRTKTKFRFVKIKSKKIKHVDGFRAKSLQLIKSHFRTSVDEGTVNRVEILPVSWHNHLHGENTGVDKKLQTITLKSIPRLRHFTNDTLLDILFYTSPVYCQSIVQQVGREINTLYQKFRARNPNFTGRVSLVGHSLGSLILFDTLCHQKPPSPRMDFIKEESKTTVVQQEITPLVQPDKKKRSLSRNVSYVIGNAGTGQPFIEYPQFNFDPLAFFALGSPIGMFVTVRGIDSLGLDFCLPTCSRFFNVFHPFDPVAYRIEALINPDLADKRPVLIPHHKGRKRMHLELKETMARVGADLKQRLVDSVRSTWNTVYQLTMFGRADDGLEQEVDKVIEKQLERQRSESVSSGIAETEEEDFNAGRLNQGRRIDYVLQEAPLESFNEYVSALTSHVIYWDSEDTILLILKEIYGSMGISTDSQNNFIPGIQESTTFPPDDPNVPSTSGQSRYSH